MTVYKHDDIPDSFNYKNNRRIGDIVIFPDNGYSVLLGNEELDWSIISKFIIVVINYG